MAEAPPPSKRSRMTEAEYKKQMAALQALRTSSFQKPSWAAMPSPRMKMSLEVVRNGAILKNIDVCTRAYFLLGKVPKAADVVLEHESISRIHAAIVHHVDGSTKLFDLKSKYGTTLNGKKLEPRKEYTMNSGDSIRFGASSRTYIVRVLRQGERAAILPAKPKESGQFGSLVQTVVLKKKRKKKKKAASNAALAALRPQAPAVVSSGGAVASKRAQPILKAMPTQVKVLKKYTFVSGQKPTEIKVGELPEDIRKHQAKNGTDQQVVEAKVELDDDDDDDDVALQAVGGADAAPTVDVAAGEAAAGATAAAAAANAASAE